MIVSPKLYEPKTTSHVKKSSKLPTITVTQLTADKTSDVAGVDPKLLNPPTFRITDDKPQNGNNGSGVAAGFGMVKKWFKDQPVIMYGLTATGVLGSVYLVNKFKN